MRSSEQKKLMRGQVWARRDRLRSRSQITMPSGLSPTTPSLSATLSGARQWWHRDSTLASASSAAGMPTASTAHQAVEGESVVRLDQ
jgi:hypothetical protein